MLSQVERGETSPTLQVAARIAAGLDLRLSQLLRLDEDGAVSIVRRSERGASAATATPTRSSRRRCPASAPRSPSTRSPPAPHRRAGRSANARAGSRETVLLTSGAVTFSCDGADHQLREGDAVTFDADLPHHFVNHGKEEAVLLGVLSAGLRRS